MVFAAWFTSPERMRANCCKAKYPHFMRVFVEGWQSARMQAIYNRQTVLPHRPWVGIPPPPHHDWKEVLESKKFAPLILRLLFS